MIHIIENHDEALHIWLEAQQKEKTVIHVDAHSDIQKEEDIHIGTYIYHAVKLKIINKYYWVIPNPSIEDRVLFKRSISHLQKHGINITKICYKEKVVEGNLDGCYIWMGALESIPQIQEDVLLDVDIDYFVVPRFLDGKPYTEPDVYWRHPKSLTQFISERQINFNIATICTSIIGGYTPVQWRCIAYYILELLRNKQELFPLEKLGEGSKLYRKDNNEAIIFFKSLLKGNNKDRYFLSTVYYWIARIYIEKRQTVLAKKYIEKAINLDSYFKTPWISTGFLYYYNKSFNIAYKQFDLWQDLMKDYGMFYCFWSDCIEVKEANNIEEAISLYKKALEVDYQQPDAHLNIGNLLRLKGDVEQAIKFFEQSIHITIAGSFNFSKFFPIQDEKSKKIGISAPLLREIIPNLILCYITNKNRKKVIQWYSFLKNTKIIFDTTTEFKIILLAPYLVNYNIIYIIKLFLKSIKELSIENKKS